MIEELSKEPLYIGGAFCASTSDASVDVVNPATGGSLGTVPVASFADVDAAVAAARHAFENGWGQTKAQERARLLKAVAAGIKAHAAELTEWEMNDAGAIKSKARNDVSSGAFWFTTMAGLALKVDEPQALPQSLRPSASYNFVRHEPIGVAAAVIPWNFAFLMACWKISMALAAGDTIVLKPSSNAMMSTLALARVIAEAGVPDGVVNILAGDRNAGSYLLSHPGVDRISFTGSVEVGKEAMRAAASTIKSTTLELGGKSAQIVLPGADWELAVDGSLYAAFYHSGQACEAGTRLLIPEAEATEFLAELKRRAHAIVVGAPGDAGTTMGPLISQRQLERVERYASEAKGSGIPLLTGGNRVRPEGLGGYFHEPTIFYDVPTDSALAQEEIFGPILSVITYQNIDEAVAIANGTIFGLAGGVWGPSDAAIAVASRMRTGTVWINDYHLLSPLYPFGGYGQSGLGREFGLEGLYEWMEVKHVHVALDTTRDGKRWFDATVPR